MLSLTREYALRAMIYLAQHGQEGPIPGGRVAEHAGIPRKYLSKVLGDLVRAGVLNSTRGIGGGFQISRSPEDIRLIEVLSPFEPILANRRPCPFGAETCSDDDPCAGHDRWKHVREAYSRFLEETSVRDITEKQRKGGHRAKRKGSVRLSHPLTCDFSPSSDFAKTDGTSHCRERSQVRAVNSCGVARAQCASELHPRLLRCV